MTATRLPVRRSDGGPKGYVRVYKLAPAGCEDALAWVAAWYAQKGWDALEPGAVYTQQGSRIMVSLWAKPPKGPVFDTDSALVRIGTDDGRNG